MPTRLKIDLQNGILEVEGNEQLVKKMYNEWKGRFNMDKGAKKAKPQKKKASKKGPSIIEDLTLAPAKKMSLKALLNKVRPTNRQERFLCYVYFLSQHPEVKKVTPAHVHTCMVKVGEKPINSMPQSLYHVKRNTGWLENSKEKGWVPSERGKQEVEKRLK